MRYSKCITLKDGRPCTLRNGTEQDGKAALDNFVCLRPASAFMPASVLMITSTKRQVEDIVLLFLRLYVILFYQ